jgi:hypothetical protein
MQELCKDMGMEERCNTFAYRARTDYNWAFSNIIFLLLLGEKSIIEQIIQYVIELNVLLPFSM